MSTLDLAPIQTSQTLAEASEEEFWNILHPEGTDAFLRKFCKAIGVPQSEVATNPAKIIREYKLAYRDMLRAWEKHRRSLENYDYTEQGRGGALTGEAPSTATSALTLQQTIDDYMYENKRAGTSRAATVGKKMTSLGLLTELFGPDRPLATLTKQDAQHAKRVLLELPANRNKMPKTRGLSLLEAMKVPPH
jgi:hypothetical protein